MNRNSKEFKELQKKWDSKLEKSGFEDIEQRQDGMLKRWSSRIFTAKMNGAYFEDKQEYYKSKQEYFRLAGHFLHEYDFKTTKERTIWEMHAEGASMDKITATLKSGHFKANRNVVQRTIERLSKIMKANAKV